MKEVYLITRVNPLTGKTEYLNGTEWESMSQHGEKHNIYGDAKAVIENQIVNYDSQEMFGIEKFFVKA